MNMDLSIAKDRIALVTERDSIAASQGDFLATHVPLKKIGLLPKFEMNPSLNGYISEEEFYNQYILNPQNLHQLIVVYGQSGTGKSHLIRWLDARFENEKKSDEVILFVRRSDNTLKGTIKQLLTKPEVQKIANSSLIKRLTEATTVVPEEVLKLDIYHKFLIELQIDNNEKDFNIRKSIKKGLISFLKNDFIQRDLMKSDGPIDRIYSKIAQNSRVNIDIVAEFQKEDFYVDNDLLDNMENNEAERAAIKLGRKLLAEGETDETAKSICDYLNSFVPKVIQRTSGIEPGDFEEIFIEIRKELYRQNKTLTLFIEDITSFSGVDASLLNALMENHNNRDLCRITSVLGGTNSYINDYFRDNHKDRVTQFIYIPDDAFDAEGRCELVARYINAMSLPSNVIDQWLRGNALPQDYPVHNPKQGKNWEYFEDEYGHKLYLYPFNRNSIEYYYKYALNEGNRSPRYIIRDIIDPVVRDLINNRVSFPLQRCTMRPDRDLRYLVHQKILDNQEETRLLYFMSIWGNGKLTQYTKDRETFICGIPSKIYEDFNLPIIHLNQAKEEPAAPVTVKNNPTPSSGTNQKVEIKQVSEEKKDVLAEVGEKLHQWVNGSQLYANSSGGMEGYLRQARIDMSDYLWDVINWQAEGLSMDNVQKIKKASGSNSSYPLIGYENQAKGNSIYKMKAQESSVSVIEAFVRWNVFGGKSWNYPDSPSDLLDVMKWTEQIKGELIPLIKTYGTGHEPVYVQCAIVMELIRKLLNGELKKKKIQNLTLDDLLAEPLPLNNASVHCNKWKDVLTSLYERMHDNRKTIINYFNLIQGQGGSVAVLNYTKFKKMFDRIRKNAFVVELTDLDLSDRIAERRMICEEYRKVMNNIDGVWSDEIVEGKQLIDPILIQFEDDLNEETLTDLIESVNHYNASINDAQINVPNINLTQFRRNADYPSICHAVETIQETKDESNKLDDLMVLSSDPRKKIMNLAELIKNILSTMDKVQSDIAKREKAIALTASNAVDEHVLQEERATLDNNTILAEGL